MNNFFKVSLQGSRLKKNTICSQETCQKLENSLTGLEMLTPDI